MLARTVLSHEELGISEEERDLLLKVLNRLEAAPPPHIPGQDGSLTWYVGDEPAGFNMINIFSATSCGTAACLLGWAFALSGRDQRHIDDLFGTGWSNSNRRTAACQHLFCPIEIARDQWGNITVEQAAQALRNYLATGEPNWKECLSCVTH